MSRLRHLAARRDARLSAGACDAGMLTLDIVIGLALISTFITAAVPFGQGMRERAWRDAARTDVYAMTVGLEDYRIDNATLPAAHTTPTGSWPLPLDCADPDTCTTPDNMAFLGVHLSSSNNRVHRYAPAGREYTLCLIHTSPGQVEANAWSGYDSATHTYTRGTGPVTDASPGSACHPTT